MSKRIVVIEDNEDLAYLLSYILKREGFEVTELHDGQDAEECITGENPPEAVVMDLMLPYADGFELLKKIRGSKTWSQVPVLMLTAQSQEDQIVRALNDGANDYLSKPFQAQEMLARLRRIIPQTA